MEVRAAVLLLCIGCNQVYGLDPTTVRPGSDIDLDFDGVDDDVDPCIASASDADEDTDNDSIKNATDPCPLDPGGTSDTDADGIPDVCDPSPLPGDRRRCTMTFVNGDLDRQLWKQHGANENATGDEWNFLGGALASQPVARSSLLPEHDLDAAPTSTLDAYAFTSADTDGTKVFRVWIRTTDGTATDAACELSGSQASSRLALVEGSNVIAMQMLGPYPAANAFRIAVTRSGGMVTCALGRVAVPARVSGTVTQRAGRFGFYFDSGNTDATIRVEALAIYERD